LSLLLNFHVNCFLRHSSWPGLSSYIDFESPCIVKVLRYLWLRWTNSSTQPTNNFPPANGLAGGYHPLNVKKYKIFLNFKTPRHFYSVVVWRQHLVRLMLLNITFLYSYLPKALCSLPSHSKKNWKRYHKWM
jgi:hypothetical protein